MKYIFYFILFFVALNVKAHNHSNESQEQILAEMEKGKLTGEPYNQFIKYNKNKDYYTLKNPDEAKNVVIIYGSFTCPHCGELMTKTMPKLKKKYLGSNLSIIPRLFISDAPSFRAAQILYCKRLNNELFNRILATLYASSSDWAFSANYVEKIKKIFKSFGFKDKEMDVCMADEGLKDRLMEDRKDIIVKIGLRSTPWIIINNSVMKQPPYEHLLIKEFDKLQ